MSINRDMQKYVLQQKKKERTPSGAARESWEDVKGIEAAIYKKNDFRVSASAVYTEATHTGVTYCRELSQGDYQLVKDKTIYDITDCNTQGRLTNLILKVVK